MTYTQVYIVANIPVRKLGFRKTGLHFLYYFI